MISRASDAPQSKSRIDLAGLDLPEMEAALVSRGEQAFHARQIYRWVYRRGVTDIGLMTDLSRGTRAKLQDEFEVSSPRVRSEQQSADGTRKFVLELGDGRQIESVFIPDTPAMTFCISTQVGCAMA